MLPKVILLNSINIDGRLDNFDMEYEIFNQISSELNFDAVLMDTNTLKNIYCLESEKTEQSLNYLSIPLLVVPDAHGEIRNWKKILEMDNIDNFLVMCSRATNQEYLNFLEENNVLYMIIGYDDVNLPTALEELNIQFKVKTILVTADGMLNNKLMSDDLVEEIIILINPKLDLNNSSDSFYSFTELNGDNHSFDLRLEDIKRLKNETVYLKYRIMKYQF
jgi:2,5-diamino-6-(ribosylamino)-4(3H)-pyrimidinone 5'-phosphate reductase